MKYLSTVLMTFLLASCSNSFINHELKADLTGDCMSVKQPVKMVSNINGERYEFNLCLDDGFDDKNYKVERKGDSLIVSFPKPATKASNYKLTLDIDAKPPYHHILLGDQLVEVVQAER